MPETTRLLPAEPFWETISAEQMEARLEFAPWTATEKVDGSVKCASDGSGCDATATGTVAVSTSQSWGEE
jgi:hypothetical protein